MEQVWWLAALWLGLALVGTFTRDLVSYLDGAIGNCCRNGRATRHRRTGGRRRHRIHRPWITFLAGAGAIVLTFLAGAELDPSVFRRKWKEAFGVGLVGFFGPFLGATAVAHFALGWAIMPSWLAGVALSTTSVAVVYAVMLELGFNQTDFGKGILAACFINDLGTVIALGLIFAPFTVRTVVFVVVSLVVFGALPFVTPWFFPATAGACRNWRRNTFFSCFSRWAGSPHGLAAKPSCRRTSSE